MSILDLIRARLGRGSLPPCYAEALRAVLLADEGDTRPLDDLGLRWDGKGAMKPDTHHLTSHQVTHTCEDCTFEHTDL